MPGQDHLNWEQHRLTEKSVHSLGFDKERREILARAISAGHPLIARVSGRNHIQILIKDDGMVTTGSTPGGGGRG
jgi:hypothetical protein